MQTRVASKPNPPVPGVIQSIADGLSTPLIAPWLLAVPILLDIYYWLGWRLSPKALTDHVSGWVERNNGPDTDSTLDLLESIGKTDMLSLFGQVIPALLPGVARADIYSPRDRATIDFSHWWIVIPVFAAVIVLAAGLFALFYVPLADAAIGRKRTAQQLSGAIGRAWVRLLAMMLVIIAALAVVVVPVAIIWAISAVFGAGLGGLLATLGVIGGVVAVILLIYTPEAIVIADVGPIRAMRLSYLVVRRNFWPTVGITLASMTISYGLEEIWTGIADSAPGLMIAIAANAFVAVGLTIAGMIFFANRLRLLPSTVSR
jgi:hypothetical protein